MVSAIEKDWPFAHRLGLLRIGSEDLVALLEKHSDDGKVTAITTRHRFSSIEDIKANLELFEGKISVSLSSKNGGAEAFPLNINFNECTTVDSYLAKQGGKIAIEALTRDLRNYRIPVVGHLTRIPMFIWAAIVIWCLWSLPEKGAGPISILPWFSDRANAGIWLFIFGVSISAVVSGFISPVFYSPRETFWQRNRDKILVSLVVGVVMLFLGAFLGPHLTAFFAEKTP